MILQTMSIKAFDAILKDIQIDNWTIWCLHHGSDYLATKAKYRKRAKPPFALMREHVANLGTALWRARCPDSACRQSHEINLRVPAISEVSEKKGPNEWPLQKYRLFSCIGMLEMPNGGVPSHVRQWREVEIAPHGFEGWPCQGRERRKHDVSRDSEIPDMQTVRHPLSSAEDHLAKSKQIISFCAVICDSEVKQTWKPVGFLEGNEISTNPEPRHFVYMTQNIGGPKVATLESVLQLCSEQSSGTVLPMRERLSIAVATATATLQCIDTVWLERGWSNKDIIVQYRSRCIGCRYVLEDLRICMVWDPTGSQQTTGCNDLGLVDALENPVNCETVVALGITLIELFFGEPLLSVHQKRRDDSSDSASENMSRLQVANDLLDHVWLEAYHNYASAVQQCLKCSWRRQPDIYGIDERFERNIFKYVVQPLAEDFENFCGRGRQME